MTTFRQLDGWGDGLEAGRSALEEWYYRVRDFSLEDLSIDDLCRACRQELFLEHVLPVALERLRVDPMAGHSYDGELASVITRIPDKFWSNHSQIADQTNQLLSHTPSELTPDVAEEIKSFIQKK